MQLWRQRAQAVRGKGFAVVADEVRKSVASKSAEASKGTANVDRKINSVSGKWNSNCK